MSSVGGGRPRLQQLRLTLGAARGGLYLFLLAAAARLPLATGYAIARRLGRLRHRFLHGSLEINRDVARDLGASPAQLERWARLSSELSASEILEGYLYPRLRPGSLEQLIQIHGLQNLEAALELGKGAILYSTHIRSVFTFIAGLAEAGYPVTIIGIPAGDWHLPLDRRFLEWRTVVLEQKYGCRFIWMLPGEFGVAVKAANVLRQNGIVIMLVDTPLRSNVAEVSWFGNRAYLSVGPAFVAGETGAPLVDFYVYRDERWYPQIAEIGEALTASGSLEETLQRCATRLEAHIRRHPEHWMLFTNYDQAGLVVRSGGHRVPLHKVEAALSSHPGVREAVALAVPDQALGNRIKAVVVPAEPGVLDAEAVRRHCADQLPAYMIPEEIELVSALPPAATSRK